LHPQPTPPPPLTINRVKTHIPSKGSNVLDPGLEIEGGSNDNGGKSNNERPRRPRFHLLISAHETTPNLCKTLLSAAALNFPSPVLMNYRSKNCQIQGVARHIHKILEFLGGDQVRDTDLVLIMDEGRTPFACRCLAY
jgi:hypothetical protein